MSNGLSIEQIVLYDFQRTQAGNKLQTHRLRNSNGVEAVLSNFGPAIITLKVPNRNGTLQNILLGHPHIYGYERDGVSFGRIALGQYANRIAHARYHQPDDTNPDVKQGGLVQLIANSPLHKPQHMLHGGFGSWGNRIWEVKNVEQLPDRVSIDYSIFDPHMGGDSKEGLPGNVNATVKVVLTNDNELKFIYTATPDITTPINLTFHGYFNLNGNSGTTVGNHTLWTNADRYLPVKESIPTGEIDLVDNTRFDFRKETEMESRLYHDHPHLHPGIDHCLIFPSDVPNVPGEVRLFSPATGIEVTMRTDQPAFQLYTGNNLQHPFKEFWGVCLEAGGLVNAVNMPQWHSMFGSPFFTPDRPYSQTTSYAFSVRK